VRIDEALAASKALDVQFGSSTLNYTIAEMEEAESRRAEKGYLVKMIQDLVEAWDLTRVEPILGDDGVQVGEREVPVNVGSAEEVRQYVTRPIIVGILKAIREDGEAGEA
jgi:hypothetical protein